jgi:hypothetical protein
MSPSTSPAGSSLPRSVSWAIGSVFPAIFLRHGSDGLVGLTGNDIREYATGPNYTFAIARLLVGLNSVDNFRGAIE